MSAASDPEILEVFLGETRELLDEADRALGFLQRRPRTSAPLRAVARSYHTLRGAAAAVGLADMAGHLEVAEALVETALGGGPTAGDPACVVEVLQRLNDSLRALAFELAGGPSAAALVREAAAAVAALRAAGESAPPLQAVDDASPVAESGGDAFADTAATELPVAAAELDALFERAAEAAAAGAQLEESATGIRELEAALAAAGRRLARVAARGRPSADEATSPTLVASEAMVEIGRRLGGRAHALEGDVRRLSAASIRLRRQILHLRRRARASAAGAAAPRAAVADVVRIEVGRRSFGLPIERVECALGLDAAAREELRATNEVRWRDDRIPALRLATVAGVPAGEESVALVLRSAGDRLALVASRPGGREEMVVHPLGALLGGHPFLAGTALAANGEAVLLIDVDRLVDLAGRGALGCAPEIGDALPRRGVLVVDDSRSVRRIAQRYLTAASIDAETAADGVEALEKLAASQYAAVVTDLEMPRLHGFELLAAIRRDPRWSHLPVIVCTSCVGQSDRQRARELGADGYVAKPFTRDQLCDEVKRVQPAVVREPAIRAATAPSE